MAVDEEVIIRATAKALGMTEARVSLVINEWMDQYVKAHYVEISKARAAEAIAAQQEHQRAHEAAQEAAREAQEPPKKRTRKATAKPPVQEPQTDAEAEAQPEGNPS